ncbi:MAG: PEP-CTERM sorting domain-containing protein [Candidatus Brocadiales bacterium]|nr:PEP-CTERM sorting domain-containing protein [Candidatus Bathyanammoxibius sp.]
MTRFAYRRLPALFVTVWLGLIGCPCGAMAGWINEIHYDNEGSDVGEFIEIVLEPGESIDDYSLEFYNGNGGGTYSGPTTVTLGDLVGGFSFFTFTGVSIQNGSPDGVALLQTGSVVPGQFLSYEGIFTATSGAAFGMMSTDLGVLEGGSTPIGFSLQLAGSGSGPIDFSWQSPAESTPGSLNPGQTLVPEPSSLALLSFGGGLIWLFARRRSSMVRNLEGAR